MTNNTNNNQAKAIEELMALKKDLRIELIRLEAVADIFDCEAAIQEAKEGIQLVEQTIEEELTMMNGKKQVMGVGRIVNGRLTFVSAEGTISIPVIAKGADFDQDFSEIQTGVMEVFFPTVSDASDMEGADFDETPEGMKLLEEIKAVDLAFRIPAVEKLSMEGADFDDAFTAMFPTVKRSEQEPMEGADFVEILDARFPAVERVQPEMGCDWKDDERDYDAFDRLFGRK